MRLRGALLRAHRWTGMACGAVLVLMGLTGSFNVYHRELDAWLNPAYYRSAPGTPRLTPDDALARVRAQHSQMEALNIALPAGGQPYWVWFRDDALSGGAPGRQFQAAVDPRSGELIGPRLAWGGVSFTREEFVRTIYRLHYELWAGPAGKTAVGLVGVFLFLSVAAGVTLAWPRRAGWRQVLTVKRGARGVRALYDWHRAGGAWSALVLGASAFSGAYMIFPAYFHAAASPFGAVDDPGQAVHASGRSARLSLDAAARIARARFPAAEVRFVAPPRHDRGAIRVRLSQRGEANAFGGTYVWIDPADGTVLRAIDNLRASAAGRFFSLQFPLHNGSLGGAPGRALVFAAGFVPLLLFATGLGVWACKRRPGRRRPASEAEGDPDRPAEAARLRANTR